MKHFRGISIIIITLFLLVTLSPQLLQFVTDLMWFKEIQYESVFLTYTLAKFVIGFAVFIVIFIFSYFTLQLTTKYKPSVRVDNDQVIHIPNVKNHKTALVLASAFFLGLFAALISATSLWENILLFLNQTSYNAVDPIFSRDIGFYFFNLSLFETVYQLSMFFLVAITVCNIALTIYLQGSEKATLRHLAKRLVLFAVVFFLLLIAGFQLQAANLLYASSNISYGASYVDINVTLAMYKIASFACIIAAITIPVGMKMKNIKITASGPILVLAILLIGGLSQAIVQNFVVKPSEISKERPYIQENINMTNLAYGLDNITEVEFSATGSLTMADLQEEVDTINNIRVTDYRPSSVVFNQLQSMRLYYKFVDIDIDRYMINGHQQQIYISAREFDQNNLQDSAKNWINTYLKYTHGYGAVVTPVNRITSQGQPELWVKDIPPTTNISELEITRPEIYFGELTNDYVIVNTEEEEFDYPIGDTNAMTRYEGEAGIPLTMSNKLLFALNKGNYKILLSSLIHSDSKILLYRNVNERIEKIAPFLTFEQDPYLIIDQGRLVWMIDAYTTSDKYPYATPVSNRQSQFYGENYIRNSVKVTVDAYDGTTNFYIVDENDPIIQSYANIFPSLFQSFDEMPENLKRHIQYPSSLFEIQTEIYEQYHMKDPGVFYNKEDVWSIAKEVYGKETVVMEPYYVNMRLPESNQLEYLLMRPFTPLQKDNMVAWLAARNDGEHYGELVLFKFPKQSLIYGPMQIEARISNDSEISQNLTLWDQQGSSVIRGDLLVIPIKDSILYVEPIYLTTDNANSLPEVIRIIVAYQDQIVMEKTLEDALYKIFGGTTTSNNENNSVSQDDTLTYQTVIRQIKDSLSQAKSSSQSGNWAEYGQYMNQLESWINQLESTSDASTEPSIEDVTTQVETSLE